MSSQETLCSMCERDATYETTTGRLYCSKQCQKAYSSRVSSETMSRTNRRHASARMKKKNPMHKKQSRDKMKRTLKRIGHKPAKQGGKGRGPTLPQKMLAEALGWEMELVVKTGFKKQPYWYGVDVANETLKVAIEVDGPSHGCLKVKEADRRKEEFLRGAGWKVLRFTNEEVLEDIEKCVQMVMSTIWRPR